MGTRYLRKSAASRFYRAQDAWIGARATVRARFWSALAR